MKNKQEMVRVTFITHKIYERLVPADDIVRVTRYYKKGYDRDCKVIGMLTDNHLKDSTRAVYYGETGVL